MIRAVASWRRTQGVTRAPAGVTVTIRAGASILGAWVAIGVLAAPASAAQGWTAYVAAGSEVTPFATSTNTSGTPIGVPTTLAVALAPNGRTLYATSNGGGGGSVIPIDTATGVAGAAISVASPVAIAITPDGTTAYVVDGNESANGSVTPVNLATGSPGTPITVGKDPEGIAITPDGKTAYVANDNALGTVTPIDLKTGTPGTPITVGNQPATIAITPDGRTAYVANSQSGNVTPIDTATNSPRTAITIPAGNPAGIAIMPDGKTAYVANDNTSGSVTPVDVASGTPGTPIPAGVDPVGIAITPDGKTAYVADADSLGGTVTPIDTATSTPETAIPIAAGAPSGIAITPDQAPVAAFSAKAAAPASPSTFDASASSTGVGSIASYAWNFGDGQSAVTTTPSTSHAYASPGIYTARLTVTNTAGTSLTQVFTGQTMSLNGGPEASATHTITIPAAKGPPPKGQAPTVTQVAQTHALWREGHALATVSRGATRRPPPVGTTFRFTLNEQARVSLAFTQTLHGRKVHSKCLTQTKKNRHKHRCTTTLTRGTLSLAAPAGRDKVTFQGRVSASKKLRPGHYSVVIIARTASGSSKAKKLSFTIAKG